MINMTTKETYERIERALSALKEMKKTRDEALLLSSTIMDKFVTVKFPNERYSVEELKRDYEKLHNLLFK